MLTTAVLQAVAPPLVGFRSAATDPPLVPPGPFFAVWGVVLAGCLAVAVWGLPVERASTSPYRLVQVPLSLVQLGFVGWLCAAASSAGWLTVPIFMAMLAGLVVSLRNVLKTTRPEERASRMLLGGVLGVYAGWSTAAVWINIATVLPDAAFAGVAGVWLQCVFVLAATAAAAAGAYLFAGQWSYVLAAGWALAGVIVSAILEDLAVLAGSAAAGLLIVAAVAVAGRRAARFRTKAA